MIIKMLSMSNIYCMVIREAHIVYFCIVLLNSSTIYCFSISFKVKLSYIAIWPMGLVHGNHASLKLVIIFVWY